MNKANYVLSMCMAGMCIICSCGTKKTDQKEKKLDSAEAAQIIFNADSASIFSNNVSAWLDSNLKKVSGFRRLTLEEQWKDDSLHAEEFITDKEFFDNYSEVLRWSPDSSFILDIGSYGMEPVTNENGTVHLEAGEPDTEIALLNRKTNERTRLIFVGPSAYIINGIWLNSSDALILGTFKTDSGQTDTLMWMIDVNEKLFRLYNVKTKAG